MRDKSKSALGSALAAHLTAAVPVGLVAGIIVGLSEAAAAAGAGLPPLEGVSFWLAWSATVGVYAILGAVVFALAGLGVSLVTVLFHRPAPSSVSVSYWPSAAVVVPAALIACRPDLSDPNVRMNMLSLGGAYASLLVFSAYVALSTGGGRVVLSGSALVALVAGGVGGGAVWARRSAGGLTGNEQLGAIAIGGLVGLTLYALWARWLRSRRPVLGRRVFRWLVAAAVTVTGVGLPLAGAHAMLPSPRRAPRRGTPNVLLVTVDALRADRLGVYGNERRLTPHLDSFARDALTFEQAFASAPWTASSLGTMLTSRLPSELGLAPRSYESYVVGFVGGLLTPQPTLAELMRAEGYVTAAEVVNPTIRSNRRFGRGFDRFRNPDDPARNGGGPLPRFGIYQGWFTQTALGRLVAGTVREEPGYYQAPGLDFDDAERLVRDGWLWLKHPRRRPFFMWMHLMDPHLPYDPPQKSATTLAAFPRPSLKMTPELAYLLVHREVIPDDQGKRYLEALYNDEVRYADRWLGWLLDQLRRAGLYDDMLIIISADHGEEFWDHGGFEHGHSVFDEVLHVPLLVKLPRNESAGRRVPAQVGLIDLLPTVLAVSGLPRPTGVRGRSLIALARAGEAAPDDRELFVEHLLYGAEQKALRTARHKVILHPRTGEVEAYDLRTDPGEHHNLAGGPRAPFALRGRLLALTRASEQRTAAWLRAGVTAAPLDERTTERLRSLGYVAP
ncbi:MAG TPA: sulfatase [Armatimonadota bacterium]|nr:sulfatase [Armatimonadota bacterium]